MGLFGKLFNNEMKDIIKEPPVNDNNINKNVGGNFHMTIQDVFTIAGCGTVVTGTIDSGEVHVGDTVTICGTRTTEVLGVEMFRKSLDFAKAGDACGLLLKDISKDEIHNGDYLAK